MTHTDPQDPWRDLVRTETALTAGQLRKFLQSVPDDQVLVLSCDAEGNRHSPLARVELATYVPDSTWSGEVYCTPEQVATDPETAEGWDGPDGVAVVVLIPTN